ncbi:MAG: Fe(3+) ABC transporter substrate-binding protein [Burkholderiaceae bacterium]
MQFSLRRLLAALMACVCAPVATAADQNVVNLYSARHYQTDQELYAAFTRQTGIEVRVVEGNDAALLERIRSEGENGPADVLLLADAARLWKAEETGLFQPVQSAHLNQRIPARLRAAEGPNGTPWFGFSIRARVIAYNRARIDPKRVAHYADLADPSLRGQLCTRSGSHPYMLSLIASRVVHEGEAATQAWARSAVENFARKPRGGDTDQIRATAIGECTVALTNSYYYARLMRSDDPADREVIAKVGLIWPDQDTHGTHINVSGGGMVRGAPHPEAAKAFLEYLASDPAQKHFAEGNNEWPAVDGVAIDNPALAELGEFKADPLPLAEVGATQATAARIVDRVGWR